MNIIASFEFCRRTSQLADHGHTARCASYCAFSYHSRPWTCGALRKLLCVVAWKADREKATWEATEANETGDNAELLSFPTTKQAGAVPLRLRLVVGVVDRAQASLRPLHHLPQAALRLLDHRGVHAEEHSVEPVHELLVLGILPSCLRTITLDVMNHCRHLRILVRLVLEVLDHGALP